jgi:hypothetical protein
MDALVKEERIPGAQTTSVEALVNKVIVFTEERS